MAAYLVLPDRALVRVFARAARLRVAVFTPTLVHCWVRIQDAVVIRNWGRACPGLQAFVQGLCLKRLASRASFLQKNHGEHRAGTTVHTSNGAVLFVPQVERTAFPKVKSYNIRGEINSY